MFSQPITSHWFYKLNFVHSLFPELVAVTTFQTQTKQARPVPGQALEPIICFTVVNTSAQADLLLYHSCYPSFIRDTFKPKNKREPAKEFHSILSMGKLFLPSSLMSHHCKRKILCLSIFSILPSNKEIC